MIIGCFITLALAKYQYADRFLDFISVLRNDKYLNSGLRKTTNWHPFNILITLVQICAITLTLFLIYTFYTNKEPAAQPFLFVQLLLGYVILIFSKGILEYVVTYFLGLKTDFDTYLFKKISYRNFLGMVLLVWSCVLVYGKINSNILIVTTLCISGLILLIMMVNIASKYRSEILAHPFYFILYFCALEIAPYYILYKGIEL